MTEIKSNLDNIFKTDKKQESEGIWFEIQDGIKFKVKRFGGMNNPGAKAALAKYHKPYAAVIASGTLPEEKNLEISVKVFIEACMLDWEGVEIDGKKVEFSFNNAVALLVSLPELAQALIQHASDKDNYKVELGNS